MFFGFQHESGLIFSRLSSYLTLYCTGPDTYATLRDTDNLHVSTDGAPPVCHIFSARRGFAEARIAVPGFSAVPADVERQRLRAELHRALSEPGL